jgi:transposase-like protein
MDPAHVLHHGPYQPPPFRLGEVVFDDVRGEVVVCGLSDGRIPWPIGKRGRAKSLVVCGGLAAAVRQESNLAVCHWWGVTPQTVSKWRKALGVGRTTAGTSALLRAVAPLTVRSPKADANRRAKDRDPGRREKIAASRRGKPRPPEVRAILAENLSQGRTREVWEKVAAAHRKRGTRPPKAGQPWSPAEDAFLLKASPAKVAQQTGRTLNAVYKCRRYRRVTTTSLTGTSPGP